MTHGPEARRGAGRRTRPTAPGHSLRPAVLGLTLTALASGAGAAPSLTAQDIFDEVIYGLATLYNGPSARRASDLRRTHLPALQQRCAQQRACPPSEAYPVIQQVLKDLNDPHTNFYDAAQLLELQHALRNQGNVREFGVLTEALSSGGRVVLEVLPDSAAARAGWRAGDVLRQVNGVPLDGSAGAAAWNRVTERGQPTRITGTRQGQAFQATLTATPLAPAPVSLTRRADGTAVVRLRQFISPTVAQQVHDLLRKTPPAQGVILDLRRNGGGRVEQFMLTAGAFTDPAPLFLKTRLMRTQIGYAAGQYVVDGAPQPASRLLAPTRYTGPLVVLIDRHTASAAEFLAQMLLTRPQTQVIGEPTAGLADTATIFQSLSDGSGLQITFAQMLDTEQAPLVRRVTPQITASLDLNRLTATGQDHVLEQAAALLR